MDYDLVNNYGDRAVYYQRILKILDLPEIVQKAIKENKILLETALLFEYIPSPLVEYYLDKVIKKDLTPKELREMLFPSSLIPNAPQERQRTLVKENESK